LNLRELFGYTFMNSRKIQRFERRGSSALWKDHQEFETPIPLPNK
jgi:hypothetical protein